MRHEEPNPDEGSVETHLGHYLYWKRNAAGGRTYTSDEIPTGVEVWDTCLTDFGTLCEAISMELALLGVERRAKQRKQREAGTPVDDRIDDMFGLLGSASRLGAATEDYEADLLNGILIRTLDRAVKQLRRYSQDDPMAAEIERTCSPEGIQAALTAAAKALGRTRAE